MRSITMKRLAVHTTMDALTGLTATNNTGISFQPYVKNTQTAICPSETDQTPGYGFNWRGVGYQIGRPDRLSSGFQYTGLAIAKIEHPSQLVIMADSYEFAGDSTMHRLYAWAIYSETYREGERFARHNGGNNFNFADGHAKWLRNTAVDAAAVWYYNE